MMQPNFNPNMPKVQPGFEQVKVLYEKRKEDYIKNKIEVQDNKEIMKEVINEIFDKEINPEIVKTDVRVDKFNAFENNDNEDEQRSNRILEGFVKDAFEKSIPYAIMSSRKTSNAFIVDRFHDILVDKFYDELLKQNKIKK